MTTKRFSESLIRLLDPDNMLGENTRRFYEGDIIKAMEGIVTELKQRKKEIEAEQAEVIKFAQWSLTECQVLAGLSIFLHQDGALQLVNAPLPCRCDPEMKFCTEYEHEYELKIRMNRGRRTPVNIHYVFSQTQHRTVPGWVSFDEVEREIKKNDIRLDDFPGKARDEVLAGIRMFIDTWCNESVEDFIEHTSARRALRDRHPRGTYAKTARVSLPARPRDVRQLAVTLWVLTSRRSERRIGARALPSASAPPLGVRSP